MEKSGPVRILLVTATRMEMDAVFPVPFSGTRLSLHTLVGGIGSMETAYSMGQLLAVQSFDFAINAGIAGSFSSEFPPGTVVQIGRDRLAELGAEDGDAFLTAFELGFLRKDFPYAGDSLENPYKSGIQVLDELPRVDGISVNTVHGQEQSIQKAVARFHPQVETMEGAAFFYACLMNHLPFAAIRAISNFVERRNKANWKTGLALEQLRLVVHRVLQAMDEQPEIQ